MSAGGDGRDGRHDGEGRDGRGDEPARRRGPIAWMAARPVAANLLMLVMIVGGLFFASQVKQEVFPEVDLGIVVVEIALPAATPAEIEQGILLAVEEAVRGLDGVKSVRATATEGLGVTQVDLFTFADPDQLLADVKSAVGRIGSFPQDAEQPVIRLATNRQEVISLIVHGDVDLATLKQQAERMREDLLRRPGITLVEVQGLPPPEISIEIPQQQLRRHGLTLPEVAARVAAASVDLSAGTIESPQGETALRVTEQRSTGAAFGDVAVVAGPDGGRVTLGRIATIVDGLRDADERAFFDGRPAARIDVFRVGGQTPIEIAREVRAYRDEIAPTLPPALQLATWNDRSEVYADRVGLLVENGLLGVGLVLVVLGLFLQTRTAFWVTLGMPAVFLGAFLFMPALGVSINMISLFAFLLVLGIVVDDAIVVGESAHAAGQDGLPRREAAVAGAREVVQPVTFAVTTTVIAFTPLLFVPGVSGDFFRNIPLIVIPILLLSLVESFFVLPAHLAHGRARDTPRLLASLARWQQRFADGLERFGDRVVMPFVEQAVRWRYLTLACAAALLMLAAALVAGGRIAFHFFPQIQGEIVSVEVELPVSASLEQTQAAMARVVQAAQDLAAGDELGGGDRGVGDRAGTRSLVEGVYASLGRSGAGQGGGPDAARARTGSHLASVAVALVPAGSRTTSAREFTERWRERVGEIPGVERLAFAYSIGPSAGAAVAVELSHDEQRTLRSAATRLAERLRELAGVHDVDAGWTQGEHEVRATLRPTARALGIDETMLARQLRGAFYGVEAQREQRGRDEVRVFVRLPREATASEHALGQLVIRAPGGGELPLAQAAHLERARGDTRITRQDGRRIVTVTADIDPSVTTGGAVSARLAEEVLPALAREFPGLSHAFAGEQEEQQRTLAALGRGMLLALFAMYAVMAVAFGRYVLPLIVLAAIPFGIVGAVLGHLVMGYALSLVSMLGIVALAGVVVNDSLVLVHAVETERRERGKSLRDAILAGTRRRFRPVLLTSLTTFFGLAPMIFETSLQARFLIPMALSLGFGVLFVTLIVLVLLPAQYQAIDDVSRLARRARRAMGS